MTTDTAHYYTSIIILRQIIYNYYYVEVLWRETL